jgi:hypothetical protein
MEKYVSNIKKKIYQEIQGIEKLNCNNIQESKLIISLLEKAFEDVKSFIVNYSFKDESEEIYFFKEIKPQLFCQLVYHNKVYNLEMRMPTGSVDDRKAYLVRALSRINYFFDMNTDFYQYYRSGSTHLDNFYFLRGKPDIQLLLDSFYFERDALFSTCYDFKLTKIIANEMLEIYINSKLAELCAKYDDADNKSDLPKVKVSWTGKKTELIELIYAWIEANSFNHGKISIKEIVDYMEKMFNINLGDYYHVFLDMRGRKGSSRTIFLDKLIKLLNDRMDNADKK